MSESVNIENKISFLAANAGNIGAAREASGIRYLVYHYTGNDGDTAMANAKYYANTIVKASAHYFVDDDSIVQSVGDLRIAWAVGGKKWSDCDKTGGGTLHGIVTNANSISIEMCDVARDGKLMATEATLENAAALGRMLMAKYGIPIENVVRHFDVTGKYCPAYFMDNDKWAAFKTRLIQDTVVSDVAKCKITLSVLSRGCSGDEVIILQVLLVHYGAKISIDGSFGPKTEAALKEFQRSHGLTVDGSCGQKTWTVILCAA